MGRREGSGWQSGLDRVHKRLLGSINVWMYVWDYVRVFGWVGRWVARLGLRQLFAPSPRRAKRRHDAYRGKGASPIDRSIDDRRATIPRSQTHDRASFQLIPRSTAALSDVNVSVASKPNRRPYVCSSFKHHRPTTITGQRGSRHAKHAGSSSGGIPPHPALRSHQGGGGRSSAAGHEQLECGAQNRRGRASAPRRGGGGGGGVGGAQHVRHGAVPASGLLVGGNVV